MTNDGQSQLTNQTIIVSMGADPKPSDHRSLENTESAVAKSDANGINVFGLFYLFGFLSEKCNWS